MVSAFLVERALWMSLMTMMLSKHTVESFLPYRLHTPPLFPTSTTSIGTAFRAVDGQSRYYNSCQPSSALDLAADATLSNSIEPNITLAQQLLCACVVAQEVVSKTGQYPSSPYISPSRFNDNSPQVIIGGIRNDDCCIIGPSGDAVAIAFRGTTGAITDWMIDASALHEQERRDKFPGSVHIGLHDSVSVLWSKEAWNSAYKPAQGGRPPNLYIRDTIRNLLKEHGLKKVVITGHR